MNIILLKLILTPLIIILATFAVRRWGPVVGGWIVGLPLTSGPVSVFLYLEQGREFAAVAAGSTIFGTLAFVSFCLAYARAARKFPWQGAALIALAANFTAICITSQLRLPPVPATLAVVALVALALYLEGSAVAEIVVMPAPWWDLPFRMVAATTVVMGVTYVSSQLGPAVSGVLSTFPVFICVMSIFTHKMCGTANVIQLERGVTTGAFSFAAFFLVVALTMRTLHPALAYGLACLVTVAVNLGLMLLGSVVAKRS